MTWPWPRARANRQRCCKRATTATSRRCTHTWPHSIPTPSRKPRKLPPALDASDVHQGYCARGVQSFGHPYIHVTMPRCRRGGMTVELVKEDESAAETIAPHGGQLINRLVHGEEAVELRKRAADL